MDNNNTLTPNQEFKVPEKSDSNTDGSNDIGTNSNPNSSIHISDPYDYILNTHNVHEVEEKNNVSDNSSNTTVNANLQESDHQPLNTPPVSNIDEMFSKPHQVNLEYTTFSVDPVVNPPKVEPQEQVIPTPPEDVYSSVKSSGQGNNTVFNVESSNRSSTAAVPNSSGSSDSLIEEVDSIKSENVIAASSYILVFDLVTFVLSLIRKDKFLQFNSVQSIFFNLTFVIVFILFRVLSANFLSFFFTLLNIALFIVWLVMSIFLMYKAYNGEKFCFSFFGRIANTLS